MSVLVITKPRLMTRADMTTFVYIVLVLPFLGSNGKDGTLHIPLCHLDGRQVHISTILLAATCYVRSLGVPCSQYIDDRHNGQCKAASLSTAPSFSMFQLAEMAAYIACVTFISLGYFI